MNLRYLYEGEDDAPVYEPGQKKPTWGDAGFKDPLDKTASGIGYLMQRMLGVLSKEEFRVAGAHYIDGGAGIRAEIHDRKMGLFYEMTIGVK